MKVHLSEYDIVIEGEPQEVMHLVDLFYPITNVTEEDLQQHYAVVYTSEAGIWLLEGGEDCYVENIQTQTYPIKVVVQEHILLQLTPSRDGRYKYGQIKPTDVIKVDR